MKLASYKDGSRDGQLVVVSRDLSSAHYATGIAHSLQSVLDDWNFLAPQLQDLYETLNHGKARHAFVFDPAQCLAPLPRAYQWVSGCGYGNHLELLQRSLGLEKLSVTALKSLARRGASDVFLGPCEEIRLVSETLGLDFEAGLAVVTADVPMQATPAQALEGVRLVLLSNDLCLRQLAQEEGSVLGATLQSRPGTAFGPVAATLDEFGPAWDQGRLHLSLQITWNGRKLGLFDTGLDMTRHFGQLVADACKFRGLSAGSIVGSGVVSSPDTSRGFACILEKRLLESLQDGKPSTEYLHLGDALRMEVKGRDGQSVLGAIEHKVVPLRAV